MRKDWWGGSVVTCLFHPVAKTLEMQKWPGHSFFDSESLSSLPSLPFCFRAASPGPFPSPVDILVVLSVVITLTCFLYSFPHLIDLTISARGVLHFIPPKSCYFCAYLSLSLLCNLTSSSWFPIICNNKGKRKFPPSHNCCRRGIPSRAWNWALVWHSETNCLRGHMCWQSKRFYWAGRPRGEQQGKGTQENSSASRLTVLAFMVMALASGLSLANHSDSVLPGGARLVQPRWMPERRILGGGQTGGVSFWPFPNSSGWW